MLRKILTSLLMKNKFVAGILAVCAVSLTLPAQGAEWLQYRGPTFDGKTTEKIAKQWPAEGPKQVWKTPLNAGFSSITVKDGRAFTQIVREVEGVKREVCVGLDANTGKELWATPVDMPIYGHDGGNAGTDDNSGGDGPRSTPSIDGDKVYVLSSRLQLFCLEAASGQEVWKKDLTKEYAAKAISWQNAASPVIEGDLIFICGGGEGQSLLGLNKKDGTAKWKLESDKMTHATPVLATIHGVRQVIFFTQSGLASVETVSGKLLWRYAFKYNVSTAAAPVVADDIVYCSAGYGVGAGAAKIAKSGDTFTATELWRKPNALMNHWSTPTYKDGHLYGIFGFKEYGKAPLKCVDITTGEEKWSKEGFGPGNVILVNGDVLVLGDKGQLVLVEATPKAYTEISSADVLDGKCWSTPSVAGGRIYARSTKEGVCLDVPVKAVAR